MTWSPVSLEDWIFPPPRRRRYKPTGDPTQHCGIRHRCLDPDDLGGWCSWCGEDWPCPAAQHGCKPRAQR